MPPRTVQQDLAIRKMIAQAGNRYQTMQNQFSQYQCVLTMQERVGGELQPVQQARLLLRLNPRSIYMYYLSPSEIQGREVLYVDGWYDGRVIANRGGRRPALARITRALPQDSPLITKQTNHRASEIGIFYLMKTLLELSEEALKCPQCQFGFISGASINNRPCTIILVCHPERSQVFPFYYAEIFIDDQWGIPVRYISCDWPQSEGHEPELLEEYTYTDIDYSVTLTDEDFDYRNENYLFNRQLKWESEP